MRCLLQTVRAEPDPDRIRALLDVADVGTVLFNLAGRRERMRGSLGQY